MEVMTALAKRTELTSDGRSETLRRDRDRFPA